MKIREAGEGGFTLLELLIAFGIFSIIVAALYGSFFASNRAAVAVDENLLKLHEARMALDIMGREVESSLRSEKGGTIELKDRDVFGRQTSELMFETFGTPLPGASLVYYWVEEKDGKFTLMKSLGPAWSEEPPSRPAPLVEDVVSFTVEAEAGDKLLKTWRGGAKPQLVRITLEVKVGGKSLVLTETVVPEA